MNPTAVADDEDAILAIVNAQHKLAEFIDKKNFKTYDELSRKLVSVLNSEMAAPSAESMGEESDDYTPPTRQAAVAKPAVKNAAPSDDEDDEAMSYFKKIEQED